MFDHLLSFRCLVGLLSPLTYEFFFLEFLHICKSLKLDGLLSSFFMMNGKLI